MKKPVLYINGDSWLAGPTVTRFLDEKYDVFNNYMVINHSIYGSSNTSIIQRTKEDVDCLKSHGITPYVIIGLSEVGRGLTDEFKLYHVDKNVENDLNLFLKNVLKAEIKILDDMLSDCPRYICSAWTTDVNNKKNLIDFIEDKDDYPESFVIDRSREIIGWLNKYRKLFNFSKSSIADAIENGEIYRQKLMDKDVISKTMHLNAKDEKANKVYEKFFKHVINLFENKKQ